MSTYVEVLDLCECGHLGLMHVAAGGQLHGCVDVTHYKACGCRKFVPKEEAK